VAAPGRALHSITDTETMDCRSGKLQRKQLTSSGAEGTEHYQMLMGSISSKVGGADDLSFDQIEEGLHAYDVRSHPPVTT